MDAGSVWKSVKLANAVRYASRDSICARGNSIFGESTAEILEPSPRLSGSCAQTVLGALSSFSSASHSSHGYHSSSHLGAVFLVLDRSVGSKPPPIRTSEPVRLSVSVNSQSDLPLPSPLKLPASRSRLAALSFWCLCLRFPCLPASLSKCYIRGQSLAVTRI
jgi:hypothetical protein